MTKVKKKQYRKSIFVIQTCHCGCGLITTFNIQGYAKDLKKLNITVDLTN